MAKQILTPQAIADLESMEEGHRGYFYRMIQYLEDYVDIGVGEGKFTREEAEHDLELSLRMAYACNNADQYEFYYQSVQWLRRTEDLAHGCGAWYYRYACALMYCGQPEEALRYASQGTAEDPDYPWGWLLLARLRSHFGDREGALDANARGLELVPGDYEFTRQAREIEQGCTLEQMENHWIFEEEDSRISLQPDPEKLEAIAGIVCDEEGFAEILSVLSPVRWEADCPYCTFVLPWEDGELELVFCMNRAALSKAEPDRIRRLLETLPQEISREMIRQKMRRRIPADARVEQVAVRRDWSLSFGFAYDAENRPVSELFRRPVCP